MQLEELFRDRYRLTEEEIRILLESMEHIRYAPKEVLVEEGSICRYLYFIEKGVTRSYVCRDGKEVTVWVSIDCSFIPPFSGLARVETSRVTVEAVEDTLVWRITKERMDELFRSHLSFANLGRELTENILAETDNYFIECYWMNKQEQYRFLLNQAPNMLQRISLQQIASYLNVTPQSLSRIRASMD